jgi:hypothetical protein
MSFLDAALAGIKRVGQTKMRARDTVQGSMGDMHMTVTGIRRRVGNLKSFSAKEEYNTEEIGILGLPSKQTKVTSVSGSFEATLYMNQSDFVVIATAFRTLGFLPEISFVVEIDDPTSAAGRAAILYSDVTFDNIDLQNLNVEDSVLEQSVSGHYGSMTPLSLHNSIQGMI